MPVLPDLPSLPRERRPHMKRTRALAFLLALTLVIGLFPAALPALAAVKAPVAKPPAVIKPPIVKPPIVAKPPAGGGSTAAPKKGLQLTVDKTKATVGDTLVFKASWEGAARKKSIVLWIFNGKERVQVLTESPGNRWEYKVTSPGTYKGMAIGRDATGKTLYKDSPKVVVTAPAPGGTQVMSLTPPLAIESIPSFSMVEGTAISPIPVKVLGKPEVKDVLVAVYGLNPILSWHPRLFHTGLGYHGDIKSLYISNSRAMRQDDPQFVWKPGEFERKVKIYIKAVGKLDGKKVEAYNDFEIRYLRDSNRNSIADIFEGLDKNPLQLTPVSDQVVLSSFLFDFHLIDSPKVVWPVAYQVSGTPSVRVSLSDDPMMKDGKFDKPYPVTARVGPRSWAEHEVYRDGTVYYSAADEAGQTAQSAFKVRVLRDSDGNRIPDSVLSIEPIPMRYIVHGQPIKPIPITVRTSLSGDVDLKITRFIFQGMNFEDADEQPVNETVTPQDEGLSIVSLTPDGPSQGQDPDIHLHKFEVSGQFMPRYRGEESGYGISRYSVLHDRRLIYTVTASIHGYQVSTQMRILAITPSERMNERGYSRDCHQFVPIPDRTVKEDEYIRGIRLELENVDKVKFKNLYFQTSPLPAGLAFDPSGNTIRGTILIDDWQPWEQSRRFSITAYALADYSRTDEKGKAFEFSQYVATEQFYITVLREGRLESPPLIHIPDQTMRNMAYFPPIRIGCVSPDVSVRIHEVKGLPPGVRLGPGNILEGRVNVKDWGEKEVKRSFKITASASASPPNRVDSDGVPTILMTEPQEMSFMVHVLRAAPPGWQPNDPVPGLVILPIPNQEIKEWNPIRTIPVKVIQEGDSPVKITVKGLAPGLTQTENAIKGTPVIKDWASGESMRAIELSIHAENEKGDKADAGVTIDVQRRELHILPVPNQEIKEGQAIKPIVIQVRQHAKSPVKITVEGLAKGLKENPKGTVKGTPVIKDWAGGESMRAIELMIHAEDEKGNKADANVTIDVIRKGHAPQKTSEAPAPAPPQSSAPDQKAVIKPPPDLKPDAPAGGSIEDTLKPPAPLAVKKGQRIAILSSGESPEHHDILQGVIGGLTDAGYLHGKTLTMDVFRAGDKAFNPKQLSKKGYALVIAIGQQAAQTAGKQLAGKIPLITAGVDDLAAAGLRDQKGQAAGPMTGVDNTLPAEQLLHCVTAMQPEAKTIAYLYLNKPGDLKTFSQAAKAIGMSVKALAVKDPKTYAKEGSKLLKAADLLILGQEPAQPEMLEQLTQSALAMGKPVYGFKNAHLLLGCAAACIADAGAAGSQSGYLAARLLSGEKISALPYESTRLFGIFYNPAVLEKLNITPPYGAMPMLF